MEGKIGISHMLLISKLLKLHTRAFTKFGFKCAKWQSKEIALFLKTWLGLVK